jgi:hypothetical protein
MSGIRVFMSFDLEHDRDLGDLLLAESRRAGSGFEICARSEAGVMNDRWSGAVRRRIRSSDEVIVICGAHTDASPRVSAELRIAHEEVKPYFLLWGRRDHMCTKPALAKKAEGMYSWTRDTLESRIAATLRSAKPPDIPEDCKRQT